MASLSPLTRSNLFTTLLDLERPPAVLAGRMERWKCPDCGALCHSEDEAIECCPPIITKVWVDENGKQYDFEDEAAGVSEDEVQRTCPVCAAVLCDTGVAADCCLWKDIDVAGRWRITKAVEGGKTWREAIEAETTGPQ